jgi:DNA modification methylase
LAVEFQHLLAIDGLDITITGFEIPEIDLILEDAKTAPSPEETPIDLELSRPPITVPGDSWKLGKHRVICGNALHESAFRVLFDGRRADMIFADPPYNVRIDGNATGNGSIHHREFSMAHGEMCEAEFVAFLSSSLRSLSKFSLSNSLHYICVDWRHVGELLAAGKSNYHELVNICVWVKNVGGMGSFYRSQHELICVFRNGKGSHRNNVQLGQFGRNRTNVWEYPGIQTLSKQSDEGNLLALHPTVKPVAMVADAILDCTARGEIVLDSFLGSGTTLMAAERVGRICYGIEIDPLYVDVAIRRWQKQTGETAVHAVTGVRFDDTSLKAEAQHA